MIDYGYFTFFRSHPICSIQIELLAQPIFFPWEIMYISF